MTAIVCEAASFDGSGSYDPDGTIEGYQWGFGDGTGAIGVLTSHVFGLPRVYAVTLTVTDDFGSSAVATTQATVIPVPSALQILIDLVASHNLNQGADNSLDVKLQHAVGALFAANANQRGDALNHIDAFINEVSAQKGKALTGC